MRRRCVRGHLLCHTTAVVATAVAIATRTQPTLAPAATFTTPITLAATTTSITLALSTPTLTLASFATLAASAGSAFTSPASCATTHNTSATAKLTTAGTSQQQPA